jgi:hypothetical protein
MDQFVWNSDHKRLINVTVDDDAAGKAVATHDGGGGGGNVGMKCTFGRIYRFYVNCVLT